MLDALLDIANALRLTRRSFLGSFAAALLLDLRSAAAAPASASPLFLARGPRGIWGVTDDPAEAAGEFSPGPGRVLGVALGRPQRAGMERDPRGRVGVGSPTGIPQ